MRYDVHLARQAEKDLAALRGRARERIASAIERLTEDPKPLSSRALKGDLRGLRRLRIGPYRASYTVDTEARVVTVWRIGHRSGFYDRVRRN